MRELGRSRELFAAAQHFLAGGVSSDARRMSGVPLFVDRAAGSQLWDVDGNRYLDYVLGQGPAILGHCAQPIVDAVSRQVNRGIVYSAQHEAEVAVAERLCRMVPAAERVRFNNTVGSEAVHGALRLARGHTGRRRILKFEGHYHGWFDPVLYSVHPALEYAGQAGSPATVPGTGGQQLSSADDLVLAPWNDLDALRRILERHPGEIAAVVMEPVLCNTGAILPEPGYLAGVRELCSEHGCLLIFDEIITGFRLAPGGAQEYLGITPDLATFGKAMAGGMPVSASGVPLLVDGPGPVFQVYLGEAKQVRNYWEFAATDHAAMARLHLALLDRGVNMVPRGLWFLSTAHSDADIDETIAAAADAFRAL